MLCDDVIVMSQSHSSQLQSRNHKIKSAMANINVIINASPEEVARELQKRLEKVKVQWEPLALRLRQRKEQLLFEKKQTVGVLSFVSFASCITFSFHSLLIFSPTDDLSCIHSFFTYF